MVRAWYMDNSTTDQRLEHQRNPPEFITLKELFDLSGVEYYSVSNQLTKILKLTQNHYS